MAEGSFSLKERARAAQRDRAVAPEEPPQPKVDISLLNTVELINLRREIDQRLPTLTLSEMNMEEQLLLQFHTVSALQGDCMDDDEIPLNQRVQLANSVSSTLATLVKLQQEVYTTERFRRIENLLIRVLNQLPKEQAQEFLTFYEEEIDKIDGKGR